MPQKCVNIGGRLMILSKTPYNASFLRCSVKSEDEESAKSARSENMVCPIQSHRSSVWHAKWLANFSKQNFLPPFSVQLEMHSAICHVLPNRIAFRGKRKTVSCLA